MTHNFNNYAVHSIAISLSKALGEVLYCCEDGFLGLGIFLTTGSKVVKIVIIVEVAYHC